MLGTNPECPHELALRIDLLIRFLRLSNDCARPENAAGEHERDIDTALA